MAAGYFLLQRQNSVLAQFKFKVENVKFNNMWLNFTILFVELPENGVKFDYLKVDSYVAELSPRIFYTGDRLSPETMHNGTLTAIPEHAILLYGEMEFHLQLSS